MMGNWFDESYEKLIEDIAEIAEISIEAVKEVYSYLSNIGLIDYDVEKEVFWDLYGSEEDLDGEDPEE